MTPDTTTAQRAKACKRLSSNHACGERMALHRSEMGVRRARQIARQPGFTPIANRRINAAIDGRVALIMVAAAQMGKPIKAIDAQEQAVRQVAAMLPKEQRVRGRRKVKPSKSDHPAYRKPMRATAQFAASARGAN